MPLRYESLDPTTRRFAQAELQHDIQHERLRAPERLRRIYAADYPKLLEKSIKYYDDLWLEQQLEERLVDVELRRTPKGGRTAARVPENAARLIAEGAFNHYYMRGLCARAMAEDGCEVEVYRARLSMTPRDESSELEGRRLPPSEMLQELRTSRRQAAFLGKPGSGLSVRLVEAPAHLRAT
jgi:hypothetical protein